MEEATFKWGRKPKRSGQKKPLTRKQAEVISQVEEGKLSKAEACRILGVQRKTLFAFTQKYGDGLIEGEQWDEELVRSRSYKYRGSAGSDVMDSVSLLNLKDEQLDLDDQCLYQDAEIFAHVAGKYFKECDESKRPYTVAGLVYRLGFCSSETLWNYARRDKNFARVVNRCILRVEAQRSEDLVSGKGTKHGHIFDLKNNFGWKEETHQKVNREGDPDSVTINNTQNNMMVGTPEKPKGLEEWREWYAVSMKKDKSDRIERMEDNEKAEAEGLEKSGWTQYESLKGKKIIEENSDDG